MCTFGKDKPRSQTGGDFPFGATTYLATSLGAVKFLLILFVRPVLVSCSNPAALKVTLILPFGETLTRQGMGLSVIRFLVASARPLGESKLLRKSQISLSVLMFCSERDHQ